MRVVDKELARRRNPWSRCRIFLVFLWQYYFSLLLLFLSLRSLFNVLTLMKLVGACSPSVIPTFPTGGPSIPFLEIYPPRPRDRHGLAQ